MRRVRPPQKMTKADHLFVRWSLLCFGTLLAVALLMLFGVTEWLELEQIRFLGGNPFYIGAEEAQESLLSPAGQFGLCIVVTAYLGIVLLREHHFTWRLTMLTAAFMVLLLPGMLCVLWGGILNMSAPLAAVLLTWFGSEISHLIRTA